MRTRGSQHPFREKPWTEIQSFLGGMADTHPAFEHMRQIVDSVLATDAGRSLAGTTSMHDLIVAARPVPETPCDVIAVRSPSSAHVRAGYVVIEHLAFTGRNDSIERPVAEAVPLFWRFVIEKYGINPT
jgi:hypothetical protein